METRRGRQIRVKGTGGFGAHRAEGEEVRASWTGEQQGLELSRTRVDTDTDRPAQHPSTLAF